MTLMYDVGSGEGGQRVAGEGAYAVRKIFVVVDPTRLVQPALEKAEWIAEANGANLDVYCCTYDSHLAFDHAAKQVAVENTGAWLERICAPTKAKGIGVTTRVDWDADWRTRIVEAAEASSADLIVKTSARHSQLARHLMKTSDWSLLRNVASPTLLVNPNHLADNRVVLAAVKLKPNDEVHFTLNERVIRMSHRIAAALEADLHAVTVYRGEEIYFDRQRFADRCGLPRNRVHAVEGVPHRGVAEIATEIGAGVLIVGCASGEAREHGALVADTAQRVIDEVNADVVVVPPA